MIVLVVGAVAVAIWVAGDPASETDSAADNAEAEHVPFARYRQERPAPSDTVRGDAVDSNWPEPPGELEQSEVWINALAIARDADELLDEANRARAANDVGGYQDKGRAAREAYDRALTLTAGWEEELVDTYGDSNRQVRKIMRTRSRWFDRLRVLHKTTPR